MRARVWRADSLCSLTLLAASHSRGFFGLPVRQLSRLRLGAVSTASKHGFSNGSAPNFLTSKTTSLSYVHCGQLNALEAFAWICW